MIIKNCSTLNNVTTVFVLCLLQYLKFAEFEETVNYFDKECKSKGKLVLKPQGSTLRGSKICEVEVNDWHIM